MTRPERYARGVRHGSAKLTEEQVRAIRSLHRQGHTLEALGRAFHVSSVQVWRIVHREAWAHVQDDP